MKKTLTFVLTLAMILAMFTGLTLTASAATYTPSESDSPSVVTALTSAVAGDTIVLAAVPGREAVYHLNYNANAIIKDGVTFIVEENVRVYMSGNSSQGRLQVADGGILIIKGTIDFHVSGSSIINHSGGTVIFEDGSKIFTFNATSGNYRALEGSSTSIPEDFVWDKTRFYNTVDGTETVTLNQLNGLTIRTAPIEPDDPTAPTGTDKVNGNTGIEITADPPTLIDPADPYVATIFDAGYIGGSDLWFGTHLASSEPQELPSIDNGEGKGSIISLVTYNQHKVNGIYGIKGQIGIFARNDEAKTPVIEDFSLSLEATTTKWCKDDDSAFVPKYTAHNITSGFAMGPNEDPLTLFDTDTVGYMLSDYKGVLTLPADAVLATGVATAVMTWTIEAEVI